jgi:hypothetical protein
MDEKRDAVSRVMFLLSLQRAMLGEVFPALRAMAVTWDTQSIHMTAYVDSSSTSQDVESVHVIEGYVAGDFPEWVKVESEIVVYDEPAPLPYAADAILVYSRRE